jgi:hypothetical protein
MDRRALLVRVDHAAAVRRRGAWTDPDRSRGPEGGPARTVRPDRGRTGVDQTGRTARQACGPVHGARSVGLGVVRGRPIRADRSGDVSGPRFPTPGTGPLALAPALAAGRVRSWPDPGTADRGRPSPHAPWSGAAPPGAPMGAATGRGGCPQQLRPRNTPPVVSGLGCCACSASIREHKFALDGRVPALSSAGLARNTSYPGRRRHAVASTSAGPMSPRASGVRGSCWQGGGVG